MDFLRPVEAVIPGVQGRVLAVLAETTAELNLRTIARLSGTSLAQTSRVLPSLVQLGMVERRDVPPSALFRLVETHVASRAVLDLSRARDSAIERLGQLAEDLMPDSASVVVFGSFARGDADAESDLDVVVVRPDSIDDDDDWIDSIERWRQAARRLTGSSVEVVDVGEAEARRSLRGSKPLWRAIVKEGVVVFGRPLADLQERSIA